MSRIAHFLPIALFALSCGGTGGTGTGDVDPRCVSLCTIKEPSVQGAHDICSPESAATCRANCAVRIMGVATVCASCQLEDSCFGTSDQCGSGSPLDNCTPQGCSVSGPGGTCTYPQNDTKAREDCLRKAFPRRTVSCTPQYRSVTKCADVCK